MICQMISTRADVQSEIMGLELGPEGGKEAQLGGIAAVSITGEKAQVPASAWLTSH